MAIYFEDAYVETVELDAPSSERLNQITQELIQLREDTQRMVLLNSIKAGANLIEAKSLVPRGKWGEWLSTNFAWSERKAQDMMRLAQSYTPDAAASLGDISYTKALSLLCLPDAEREEYLESHDVGSMSARQLEADLKRERQAREAAEASLQEKIQAVEDLQTGFDERTRQVQSLSVQIDQATRERDELKRQLKEKALDDLNRLRDQQASAPIEPAVIEKTPQDVLDELEELRAENKFVETNHDMALASERISDAWEHLQIAVWDAIDNKNEQAMQRFITVMERIFREYQQQRPDVLKIAN